MSVQLFAKAPGATTYQRIDLYAAEPIKLTLSVANIVDPLAANSIFSRTFKVPHTSVNGPFFKAAFNVNATDFDASKKSDAYINDNGVFFSVGNIRLSAIYVNEKTNNVEYEINYYGETSDFGSKIGGGFLSEVNLSAYNHALSYNNVVNSWSGGLLSGNVVYPLMEWGYTYSSAGLPNQGTLSVGGNRSFTGPNSNKAINFTQLKPVLKAKALWDAIFEETGYTYESTFLETDPLFTNLFVIAEDEARSDISVDLNFNADDFGITNDVGTGPGSGVPYNIDMQFPNEINDPSNSYNPANSTYTAEAPGTYEFRVMGYIEGVWSNPAANTAVIFKIVDANTGSILSTTSPVPVLQGPQSFDKSLAVVLNFGQAVKLQVEGIGPIAPVATSYITLFGCTFFTELVPSVVVMSTFMPTNIRKVDFMRSIINRFRLVFEPSKDNEKNFTITPWKDWVLNGTQRDWTDQLDGSKDMKLTPLFYSQERLQVFKDLEDADFVNYNYQLDYKQTYGQRNVDSNNELIKGTKEYQDQFAPLPLFPIGGTDPGDAGYEFLIPHLAKDTDKERQPIQPKLRLGYYNGLQPSPITWYINSTPWNSSQPIVPAIARTTYPLMSQFSTWPVTSSTFDLNWENELPLYETEISGLSNNTTPYDCFNVFWRTWYDTTFDPFSRIVEASFVLGYEDIITLKFNDYIFVKDAWYLVNKITDYVIGEESSVKVELIKVGNNIGLVIPPSTPTKTPVIDICSGTTACEAFCCTSQIGFYYITGNNWANASQIFLDQFGQTPVPDGFYSDGVITYQTVQGTIVAVANTSSCNCNPPLLTEFTVCPATTSCDACCCENATISVWGTGSDLPSSLNVYLNSSGTIPADGWYKTVGDIYSVRVVNGVTQAVGICSACNCNPVVVYPHDVTFSTDSTCDACCNGVPTTIWTDSATFLDSTVVYIDNVPLTLSGIGYYVLNGDVLNVNIDGDVVSIGSCSTCSCDSYYKAENCQSPGLFANFSSPTPLALGTVVSSPIYSGQCWTIIDTALDGDPVVDTFDTCNECLNPTGCDCTEYRVTSLAGGVIQYIDCTTQDVVYQDIAANSDQNICMCRDTPIVLAGKIKITDNGPCDVPENDFIVIGNFTNYESHVTEYVALLDATGNIVNTFTTNQAGGPGFSVGATNNYALITDDAIWVTGSFTTYNGTNTIRLIKLTHTGAIDNTYDPTTGLNNNGSSISKFSDGALVIVGSFTTYKTSAKNRIVGIQPNGTVDSTFVTGTGFNQIPWTGLIKNDIFYTYCATSNLVTYKGSSGSRFVAIDRQGNRITNYAIASTNIPLYFGFDVDNLGRVYIAYKSPDFSKVIVERWLSSGSKDPIYNCQITLADLETSHGPERVNIKVDENYACFVTADRLNSDGGYLIKVKADGAQDLTFGTNIVNATGGANSAVLELGLNNGVYVPVQTTTGVTLTYNNTTVGPLFKVDPTTGQLDPGFNNLPVVNTNSTFNVSFIN